MREETLWEAQNRRNPGHSAWYIERFRLMRQRGEDLDGEARFVDAMAERGSRLLDAGCGPGRIGGELTRRGHDVIGVDIDPELIEAARDDHPETRWLVGDLAGLDLPADVTDRKFDIILCAGQVITFVAPGTAPDVLAGFAGHLAPGGRAVIGFGIGRGYDFGEFLADAEEAGLTVQYRFSTWDMRPFAEDSEFLVAVFGRA